MAKSGYAISQYQIQRFTIRRCTIHALIVILCMPWIEWFDRKQPISHQKRRWIVRIGFDSFHLQQKATKIKPTFFPPMQISLRSQNDLTCIENRFMQFAFKLVISARRILHKCCLHCSIIFQKIYKWSQSWFTYFCTCCFGSSRQVVFQNLVFEFSGAWGTELVSPNKLHKVPENALYLRGLFKTQYNRFITHHILPFTGFDY